MPDRIEVHRRLVAGASRMLCEHFTPEGAADLVSALPNLGRDYFPHLEWKMWYGTLFVGIYKCIL